MDKVTRCHWCNSSELYQEYHDTEWGKPVHNDQKLFEFLALESFQAGLSWITILKKRPHFRAAFDNFDVEKINNYTNEKIETLLRNEGIIRHRGKIEATINNAKCFIEIQKEHGSFDHFIWAFVNHTPQDNRVEEPNQIPSQTPLSITISKDLKKRGFKFFGPTTVYAFMQATGMVNDHLNNCSFK